MTPRAPVVPEAGATTPEQRLARMGQRLPQVVEPAGLYVPCAPRRHAATSRASASSWFSPVSSVWKPGNNAKPPVPTAFGVDRDAGCGQRLDVAQHGAGGHLKLAGQPARGQPTVLAQQQHQRYQPVGAHTKTLPEYMTQNVLIRWEAYPHDKQDSGH
jgi:hypothetical protein